MNSLFKKLNLKEIHSEIVILNAPESLQPELADLGKEVSIVETLDKTKPFQFLMAFVTQQQQVDEISVAITNGADEDAVVWFCYPKGTSKKYKCDFNRDTGWTVLGNLDFEPVRMVAIDADWSALRFRKVQHIKKMTRSSALSDAGKARIGKKITP